MTHITITDRGGANPRTIKTTGADRSWSVRGSGTLSAEVTVRDMVDAGLMRPKSKWLWIDDNDAGMWGGVITDTNPHSDGTMEIAAESFQVLFSKHILSSRKKAITGPAGALALLALADAERNDHIFVQDRYAEEIGIPVELQFQGQDVRDALDGLASASGQEWWVESDPDAMDFRWRARKGADLTGSVCLTDPRHIVSYTLPDSLEPIINSILATASSQRTVVSQAIIVENVDSTVQWGRRQEPRVFTGASITPALKNAAQASVNATAQLGAAMEFRMVNTDRCFGWFREGDDIALLIPSISSMLDVRVMARSLGDNDYVQDVSATITRWDVYV